MRDFLEKLRAAAGGSEVTEREPMSRHTTFRAGGPARYFVSPAGEQELAAVLMLCRAEGMPFYILGNGSNLLVSDRGYEGVMIRIGEGFSGFRVLSAAGSGGDLESAWDPAVAGGPVRLEAGAGLLLSRIAREALARSLAGFAFAAGIPGTLGGALVMNAGAYGGEMRDVVESVRVLDPSGRILVIPGEEMEFGYRKSCIPGRGYVALSAVLRLQPGDQQQIREEMEDLAARRREKQPLEYPSAGSTFKRPSGYFAGKLIEDAGLRGFRLGGAQVSEKHCGFVINRENATAAEILALCREVKRRVLESSGVELETEIKLLGFEEEGA